MNGILTGKTQAIVNEKTYSKTALRWKVKLSF
jgi:hypothetical protein